MKQQVWALYKQGDILQMIDPTIIETCDEEKALRCIHVGLLCTQEDPSLPPEMSTVNFMLPSHSVTVPNPTKPALVWSHTSQISRKAQNIDLHCFNGGKQGTVGLKGLNNFLQFQYPMLHIGPECPTSNLCRCQKEDLKKLWTRLR